MEIVEQRPRRLGLSPDAGETHGLARLLGEEDGVEIGVHPA